ncbi:MAG: hypothetical protein OXG33_08810 [Chloroflexi bacterium]|nr:hypothetical protein [Chloroflexota bacterium]
MGLGRSNDQSLALHRRQAPADDHKAALEVDIPPVQAQQLAASEPAEHGQDEQRVDRFRLVRFEQAPECRLIQDRDGALRDAWQFDGVSRVARDHLPRDRLGQRLVDDRMHQMYGCGRIALLDGPVAQVLDVGRRDPAPWQISDVGNDVAGDDAGVSSMRTGALVQPYVRERALVQVAAQEGPAGASDDPEIHLGRRVAEAGIEPAAKS